MPVACPYCARAVAILDVKPGRFRLDCPECGRAFAIKVGDGPEHALSARPIELKLEELPPSRPSVDTGALLTQLRAAIGQRLGWAWKALTRRGAMVGGALILEELGRTSRGSLAKGRQILLGHDVTIRLLPSNWGEPDVNALARATREAYVAGQIVHPNLVRRLDFGQDATRRFVIEEAFEGTTFAGLALSEHWQGGDAALPIILQAARGLLAAHEQGMAHGEPTPEHLWLDSGGVVKLAGLGLGGASIETRDGPGPFALAANNDVHTLGRTLETLANGRKQGVNLPGLSQAVAAKMKVAGTPEGYRDLAEVVRTIETTLGVASGGSMVARGDEEARLRHALEDFHGSPMGSIRTKLVLGFFGVCLLFFLLFAKAGHLAMAVGVVGLMGITATTYAFLRAGTEGQSGLFGRVREWVLGGRRADWLTILGVKVVLLVALVLMGWLFGWIALTFVSVALALGFVVAIDVPIARDREAPLEEARKLLAEMRLRGVSEQSLREFVRQVGGTPTP